MRQLAGEDTLAVSVTVADSTISYLFTATVDDAVPSSVTFDGVDGGVVRFFLQDPIVITGTAHDDNNVKQIECVLTGPSGTQYGEAQLYSFPPNDKQKDRAFSCDYSASGLGIPTEVTLTLTVTVSDQAKNKSVETIEVFINGPPS